MGTRGQERRGGKRWMIERMGLDREFGMGGGGRSSHGNERRLGKRTG